MNQKIGCGSILEGHILRANGDIVPLVLKGKKKIHNFWGNTLISASTRIVSVNSQAVTFYTNPNPTRIVLTGNFSQSASTITRDSGTFDFTTTQVGDYLKWGTGEIAYLNTSINASSRFAFQSQTVASGPAVLYKASTSDLDNITSSVQATTSITPTKAYSAGVFTATVSTPPSFPVAPSSYTLSRIIASFPVGFCHFDVTPVLINIGDLVVITSWVLKVTLDQYHPRALSVCPLTGLTTTCMLQDTQLITEYSGSITLNKIYLIETANKITLPDNLGLSGSRVTVAGKTIKETIAGTYVGTTPTLANLFTDSYSVSGGLVVTGSTDVKQIAWGDATNIHGILEFDTPQTIAAGKVITFSKIGKTFVPVLV